MANNLGSLVVSLGLDAAEFTRGLTKEEYRAQQWARNLGTAFDGLRTAAFANFAAIGTAVTVMDRQLKGIAGFQDLADKIGDTAEQVASLKTAADLSGVALDTVAAASVKLTAALAKTDDESKGVGLALKAIGLEIETFKALSPAEQIDEVSAALGRFEDGAGKTAVAVQLFGRSGADLIPFLNDLNEEGGRNVTLTGEQIAAADEYAKSLDRLTGEVDTLAKATAADAAPALSQMVQILRDVLQYSSSGADGINLLAGALGIARTAMEAIVLIGSDVAFVFKTLGDTAGGYAAVSAALIRGDIDGAKAIGAAYREASAERRKALDDFQGRVVGGPGPSFGANDQSAAEARRLGLAFAPRGRLNFSSVAPVATPGKPPKAVSSRPAASSGRDEYQRMLDDYAKAEDDNRVGVITRRMKEEEDATRELLQFKRQFNIEELDSLEKRNTEYQKLVQTLIDDTPTQKLEQQRQTMQLLADEFERGRFGAAGSAEAIELYGETVGAYLGNLSGDVKKVTDAASQSGAIFGSWLNRAATDGVKLKDFLNGLARDYANLLLQKQLIEPAVKESSKWFDAAFGLASSYFSSYDGGGYTGMGARSGGLDGQGGFMAMLHPNETVIDHSKGQGMGGVTVVQNVSIDARGADAGVEARIQSAMRQAKAEAVAEVASRASRGGSYASAVGRA